MAEILSKCKTPTKRNKKINLNFKIKVVIESRGFFASPLLSIFYGNKVVTINGYYKKRCRLGVNTCSRGQ